MKKEFELPWGRMLLLLLSIIISIYLGFFALEGTAAINFVKHTGYWFMAVSLGLLLLQLARMLFRKGREPLRWPFDWKATLFLAAMSLWLCLVVEDGYKIVMDEPVLASTALQMYQEQEAITVARAYRLDGEFLLLDAFVDKRPFFFPFLVSLLHGLIGYNGLQGVVLNMILAPVFLGLVFVCARRFGGERAGYGAVLLIATLPLLAINANGAGFELLNLVMLSATFLAAVAYLSHPDRLRLNLLLILTVLLAQTRYESVLYVFATIGVVALVWWREKRIVITKTMLAIPLLMILFAIQQQIFRANPELWQFKGGAKVPFSIDFVPGNLIAAVSYFFSWDFSQTNSLALTFLFLAAILLFVLRFDRIKRWASVDRQVALAGLLYGGTVCITFMLLMAYHWGQLNDIIATRIALPFLLLQVFVVVLVVEQVLESSKLRKCIWFGTFLWLSCITVPVLIVKDYMSRATEQASCNLLRSWVMASHGKQALFISNKHLVAINELESGLAQFSAIRRKLEVDLHLRIGTFGAVYFVYTREPGESLPATESELAPHFELSLVRQEPIGGGRSLRMMKLESVKLLPGETRLSLPPGIPGELTYPEMMRFYAETLP